MFLSTAVKDVANAPRDTGFRPAIKHIESRTQKRACNIEILFSINLDQKRIVFV